MRFPCFLSIFLFMVFLSPDGMGQNSSVDSIDYSHLEDTIKTFLPDSTGKVDSLSRVMIASCDEDENDTLLAIGWFYRGEAAYYEGNFNQACEFYERSDELLDSATQTSRKAIVLNNLGLSHYFKERYNDALEAYITSAEIEKGLGNEYGYAQSLHNIALIYDEAGKPLNAENYFDHSLDFFLKMDSLSDAAAVYNDYAVFLSNHGDNEAALEKYNEALRLYKDMGDESGAAKVKCNMGALHLYEKEYKKSTQFLEDVLEFFKDEGDETNLVNVYSLLGDLYYEQNRSALAVVFYERAEKMALRKGWSRLRQKNLYSLFKALKAENEYEEAVDVLETYTQIKDSLIAANKAYVKESIGDELEIELKERELELERARKKENNLLLIIGGLVLVLGMTGWLLFWRNRLLKKQKEKQLQQSKLFQMQMNPHFIFNSLSSVQSYIIEENRQEALDYLTDIAQVMRKFFDVAEKELITIEEEKDLIEKYLKVQCRRYFQSVNCKVSSRIISGSGLLMVPPLLARPLIDAIFSGSKIRDCQCPGIEITFEQKDNVVEVVIVTHGVVIGRDVSSAGVEMVKERLNLLRKQYKKGSTQIELVDLFEDGAINGTRIMYQLPLIKNPH
ncbi:MAG: tetratricopeptide repeat protein [Marinilabilia sp.]